MASRIEYLIDVLKSEQGLTELEIPEKVEEQEVLYRALQNVRYPAPVTADFLYQQDRYLQEKLVEKGVVDLKDLTPIRPNLYLWQGDITRLVVDAIVNAANSKLLGCFVPNHSCIDNAIHTAAGVELRLACHEIMQEQGRDEVTGQAKMTKAYNLPSRYVLHTVGPIIYDEVTDLERRQLASSYEECLNLAYEKGLRSLAFCCISTGEFRFPNEEAAKIAIETVLQFQKKHPDMTVVFNVFKDFDYMIYQTLLKNNVSI